MEGLLAEDRAMLRLVIDNKPQEPEDVAGVSQPATLESERDPRNPNRRVLFPLDGGAECSAEDSSTR